MESRQAVAGTIGKGTAVHAPPGRLFAAVTALAGAIGRFFGAVPDERDINATVAALLPTGTVTATLDDGVVRLSGHVPERSDAKRVEKAVRDMPGIYRVIDDIVVG